MGLIVDHMATSLGSVFRHVTASLVELPSSVNEANEVFMSKVPKGG